MPFYDYTFTYHDIETHEYCTIAATASTRDDAHRLAVNKLLRSDCLDFGVLHCTGRVPSEKDIPL